MAAANSNSLFSLLNSRVEKVEEVALWQGGSDRSESAESVFRACVMLAVSALDAFVHEKSVEIFLDRVADNAPSVESIATYLRIPAQSLQATPMVASQLRYRLSFKTLVSPDKIDEAINASGVAADDVWKQIGIETGARESRLRNALELQVDRRNQIAHEGDWDPVDVALRHISVSHARDCRKYISTAVQGLGKYWT
jgi:hypothetical protein